YTSLTYLSILFIPTSTPYIYTLSLHDALPISCALVRYNLAFWRRVNMKTSLSFAFLTLALVGSIQLEAQAQENQLQITQDKQYKVKAKGDRVVVQDKSKPVRRALEEQYAKIAEANRNRNL